MTRIILYNTQYCTGLNGKKWKYFLLWKRFFGTKTNLINICKKISEYKPDIFLAIEIQKKGFFSNQSYITLIKKQLKMKSCVAEVKYNFQGRSKMLKIVPWAKYQLQTIFSNQKINKIKKIYFKSGFKKLLLKVTITAPKKFTIILMHLSLRKIPRQNQIKELIKIINNSKNPLILAGDFNTSKKEEINQILNQTKLILPYNPKTKKEYFTFPSYSPKKEMDRILVTPEIIIKKYYPLKLKLSDHLPILMDFKIK